MEKFPEINLANINGEEKKATLDQIEDACQNWGFFEVLQELGDKSLVTVITYAT